LLDVLRRSPGWWLQVLGVAHAGVGAGLYREALGDIARSTLVGSVPDRGDRATAFWFMAASPLLWLSGRLLRSAESAGDLGAQRAAGSVLTAAGVIGSAAMPRSGFWGVTATGLLALRRSSRPRGYRSAARLDRGRSSSAATMLVTRLAGRSTRTPPLHVRRWLPATR
jgi:hypothetical protein